MHVVVILCCGVCNFEYKNFVLDIEVSFLKFVNLHVSEGNNSKGRKMRLHNGSHVIASAKRRKTRNQGKEKKRRGSEKNKRMEMEKNWK